MILLFSLGHFLHGFLGLAALILLGWLFSKNRSAIKWDIVVKGLLIQFVFAFLILKVEFIAVFFDFLSRGFVKVISFSQFGSEFLFSSFGTGKIEAPLINFAFNILPTIVFFSAITSLLYYMGVLQKVVYFLALFMKKVMNLSGAESLSAAGNIFLGQTESPLLVRHYLPKMTKSELFCVMTGGMATIAGGVLASYIGFLGGASIESQVQFAKHLLAASVMSAPAAIVAAKIIFPETEKFDESMEISKDKIGANVLEAVANGTTDGLKLAINVGAMLLVFISLISLGNYFVGKIGDIGGINEWIAANTSYSKFSLQFIIGYLFAPIAWLMGVSAEDMVNVGQLLGEKTILNEFVAYISLGEMKAQGLFHDERSVIIATYILCGFANFSSIGIQIGGIGALVPEKRTILSQLGLMAMVAGTMACLFTAVIVGMLI